MQGLKTYIIKTGKFNQYSGKYDYYCGKTNNIKRRLKEHKKEKYPSWFSRYAERKNFIKIIVIKSDFENQIKRAGVKVVYDIIDNLTPAS